MATSNRRSPRMDVKRLYPNFYAEQYQHHVQETNTMTVRRKRRDGSSKRDEYGCDSHLASRSGHLPLKHRFYHRHHEDDSSTRRIELPLTERSKRAIPPLMQSSNQQEGVASNRDGNNGSVIPEAPPLLHLSSRQVAIRGELSLASSAWGNNSPANTVGVSPLLRPFPFPTALSASAHPLLETSTARPFSAVDGESLERLVMNDCPRTRRARRDLQRQGSVKTLARISTAPTPLRGPQSLNSTVQSTAPLASSRLMRTLHSAGILRRQSMQSAVVNTVESALPRIEVESGTNDDDDTNFFLTELKVAARAAAAATAAKLRVLARHITLGAFLLYGNPPALVAAIQHFTAALRLAEDAASLKFDSPSGLALASLLHHHRGVALRELVIASASPTSSIAMACIKLAFAAQQCALKLARRGQDLRMQARAVKALGVLLLDANVYGPALTHQQEALQLALEENDRELEARVYANLGNLALAQLNFGHALSCHQRDLQLCSSKTLDCRLGRARAHRNLSIVYAKLHRRDQQLSHEKQAAHSDSGAYLYDVAHHTNSSVGNICLQPSTDIDSALVALVTQNLAEIVRGLRTHQSCDSVHENDDDGSITATLKQEWTTIDVDLDAAVATVSNEAESATSTTRSSSVAH